MIVTAGKVVGQDIGCSYAGIFIKSKGIVDCLRAIVYGIYIDIDGSGVGLAIAIGYGIGETVVAGEICIRRIIKSSIIIIGDGAMGWLSK